MHKLQARTERIQETPSDWIERYFYVPDPRDQRTGEFLPPGPLLLAEHQRRIINEALSKTEDGKYKYTTVIYSAPKKSGKSALASAVTLYMAYSRPYSYIYCLANDGKQSNDRIYEPIRRCLDLHRKLGGPFAKESPNKSEVVLSNGTKVEAVNCDESGEAGAQPLFSVVSEIWGWKTAAKVRLFSETTVPPTLYGYALRWIESYAGEKGVSTILEKVYETAVKQGRPHPDFLDLECEDGPVVWVNDRAHTFCYWDHVPRMIWQTEEYYEAEANLLSASEFERIHRNRWASSLNVFVTKDQWDAVGKLADPIGPLTPVVLGVDGAISNDYAVIVGATRDPGREDEVLYRFCYIFTPKRGGGTIKIAETVEPAIRLLCQRYNVVCVAYDKYQLEDMAQRLRKGRVVWMYNFSQQAERAVADKALQTAVINHTVWWDRGGPGLREKEGEPSLYQHITQAGAKTEGESKLRIMKLSDTIKVDAAVAASMARSMCEHLIIRNRDKDGGTFKLSEEAFRQGMRELGCYGSD